MTAKVMKWVFLLCAVGYSVSGGAAAKQADLRLWGTFAGGCHGGPKLRLAFFGIT